MPKQGPLAQTMRGWQAHQQNARSGGGADCSFCRKRISLAPKRQHHRKIGTGIKKIACRLPARKALTLHLEHARHGLPRLRLKHSMLMPETECAATFLLRETKG